MQGAGTKQTHPASYRRIRKWNMTRTIPSKSSPHPASFIPHPRRGFSYVGAASRAALAGAKRRPRLGRPTHGFTLVELLVVITIIGILTALITVAAVGALKTARKASIKAELTEISNGLDEYKNKTTAYPPNCQTDGNSGPLDDSAVLVDLKRHMKQAFPRHQEPDDVLLRLCGSASGGVQLKGGMSAGEACVFWLGGFSSDPKFPISGEGGPSYAVIDSSKGINIPATDRRKADPIETRKWVYPFEIARLGPRQSDGYFDDSTAAGVRYIEYQVAVNGVTQTRRINFWQYKPSKSDQPYLYFDTSRHPAYDTTVAVALASRFDPPAATSTSTIPLEVYAFKKVNPTGTTGSAPITFVNPDKFQVLHAGIDNVWDDFTKPLSDFQRMNAKLAGGNYLLFPSGPFVGDIADTVVNFAPETTIEDAQK